MRVVLIEIIDVGPTFLAERKHEEATAPGWKGRLIRWHYRAKDLVENPKGRVSATLSWVWNQFQRLIAPDEHLLRRLRHADSLVIDHPARLTSEETASLWSNVLKRRFRKHAIWMVIDGLLAIPSAVLAFLPGPNLVGYWLAYRAVVHLFTMQGARRGKTFAITFVPWAELNPSVKSADADKVTEIAQRLEIPEFASLLAAHERWTEVDDETRHV